jgi:hypothetical protein
VVDRGFCIFLAVRSLFCTGIASLNAPFNASQSTVVAGDYQFPIHYAENKYE